MTVWVMRSKGEGFLIRGGSFREPGARPQEAHLPETRRSGAGQGADRRVGALVSDTPLPTNGDEFRADWRRAGMEHNSIFADLDFGFRIHRQGKR
jgi:hypothetical protein